MEFTWFSFALLATIFWGASDVFFKKGVDPKDDYSHWRINIMIGLMMGIQALIELIKLGFDYDIKILLIYLPVSFLYILSMTIDFYGYRYLQISVGSPVASTSGAIAGVLTFKFLGKRMTGIQFFAVSLITIAILLLAYLENKEMKKELSEDDREYRIGAKALIFPLSYAIIDAIATFLDDVYLTKLLTPEEALISFELTYLLVGLFGLFYLIKIKRVDYKLRSEKYNIFGGICEAMGQFFYVYALNSNSVVAAPLMATDGIFAAIFGRIYLKEELSRNQYITIAMIGIGVFILGFFE